MAFPADSLGKTVLIVDGDRKPREARVHRLELYGVTVHAASSIEEARHNLRTNRYHLVLLAARENPEAAIALHREIRERNPKQRVAFLVGPRHYISFTFGQKAAPIPVRSEGQAQMPAGT